MCSDGRDHFDDDSVAWGPATHTLELIHYHNLSLLLLCAHYTATPTPHTHTRTHTHTLPELTKLSEASSVTVATQWSFCKWLPNTTKCIHSTGTQNILWHTHTNSYIHTKCGWRNKTLEYVSNFPSATWNREPSRRLSESAFNKEDDLIQHKKDHKSLQWIWSVNVCMYKPRAKHSQTL